MTCYTCTSDQDPPGSNLTMRSTVNDLLYLYSTSDQDPPGSNLTMRSTVNDLLYLY
jgi:hypothetical protein